MVDLGQDPSHEWGRPLTHVNIRMKFVIIIDLKLDLEVNQDKVLVTSRKG
jgi:hypothetical protein